MYEFLNWLLHPTMLLSLLTLLAVLNLWRRRQESKRRLLLVTIPLLLLIVWSMPVVSTAMKVALESPYPPLTDRPTDAQAIVVLGGWVSGRDANHPEPTLGRDSVYRCLHAANLYHKGNPIPVLVTGKTADAKLDDPSLARVMADLLIDLGVRESHIIIEQESGNTFENAERSAPLLKQRDIHHIVLVTDAAHLSRAIPCFEQHGLEVTPAGCRYGRPTVDLSPGAFFPREDAALGSQVALHEMLGWLWYRMKGRI